MEVIARYFASRTVLYSLSFYILSCVSISQENDVLRNRLFILWLSTYFFTSRGKTPILSQFTFRVEVTYN